MGWTQQVNFINIWLKNAINKILKKKNFLIKRTTLEHVKALESSYECVVEFMIAKVRYGNGANNGESLMVEKIKSLKQSGRLCKNDGENFLDGDPTL